MEKFHLSMEAAVLERGIFKPTFQIFNSTLCLCTLALLGEAANAN